MLWSAISPHCTALPRNPWAAGKSHSTSGLGNETPSGGGEQVAQACAGTTLQPIPANVKLQQDFNQTTALLDHLTVSLGAATPDHVLNPNWASIQGSYVAPVHDEMLNSAFSLV